MLGAVPGRPPGRVRGTAPGGAPLPGRDPGAPGVPVPAHPAAPAVHRAGGRRAGALPDGPHRARRQRGPRCGQRVITADGGPPPPGADPRNTEWHWPVRGRPRKAKGVFVVLRTDQVRMPDGDVAPRDVVEHPGAVAVVALDDTGQVLLIRQYRHPAGQLLWEIPAGVRDVPGEPVRSEEHTSELQSQSNLVC